MDASPRLALDRTRGEFETVIWATNSEHYSWLHVGVLDAIGMIRPKGGIVDSPGVYLLGLLFLRRRKSSVIDGSRADAEDLICELASYLEQAISQRTAESGIRDSPNHSREGPSSPLSVVPDYPGATAQDPYSER